MNAASRVAWQPEATTAGFHPRLTRAWKRRVWAGFDPAWRLRTWPLMESRPDTSLLRCRRGAVSVEYAVVVAFAGLTLAITLVSLGPGMVQSWSASRQVLYGSSP